MEPDRRLRARVVVVLHDRGIEVSVSDILKHICQGNLVVAVEECRAESDVPVVEEVVFLFVCDDRRRFCDGQRVLAYCTSEQCAM